MEIQATKAPNVQLPPELIFDILSLLSIKSLIRFMCVSKSWHSLISSPEFVKYHLKTSSKTSGTAHRKLIFSSFVYKLNPYLRECDLNSALYAPMTEATHTEYHMYEFKTQAINKYPRNPEEYFENYKGRSVKILGSCNGLFCIAKPDRHLLLLNPSIGNYKRLPDSGLDFEYSDYYGHYDCVPSYGFWYDELHDDYKVVAISAVGFSAFDPDEQMVKVYSLRTNSWERNEASKNCPLLKDWRVDNNSGGTLLNGKLHWTANLGPHHRSEKKIVCFDLANETFGGVELPEHMGQPKHPGESFYRWTIGVLGEGCLALVCDHNQEKVDVDVWIMMEYGVRQSWTKVISVRYAEYRQYGCPFHFLVQPVFSSKNGEILLKLGSKLVLYNREDKSWRELNISNVPDESHYLKVDMYDESLVLLDAHDGQNS